NDFATDIVVHIRDAYDNPVITATNAVTLSLNDALGADIVGDATVNAVGGVATFSGLRINQVGEYTLTANLGALEEESNEFEITPKALTVTGVSAVNKVYDGITDATLDVTGAELVGVITGDEGAIELSTPVGTFDTPKVGEDIQVTAALTLSG